MKISDIQSLDQFTCVQSEYADAEVSSGYTSDLLSDVMAHADEGSVLITIQAHKNTVAVSSLAGVVAIIICNNRPIADDVLEAAASEGIAIFQTAENQFQTSSLIAQHLAGCPAA
ncbi:DRTGG domain-containing protein [Pontiella sulfatireligans]|uniref:DRTGG domain-containing protein n=1 Tax=Pontiella sulfatireligans TaxID=2750658 RepID=A0A6C2US01_9BACT|nr:DRTGG domain-containing protein [Pontiella sulfatireligans]VGO23085.1 hypothetical protein SCARR_05187 [Pontiella sulfatireligans]